MEQLSIEKFNPTVAELQNLVELTKDITATDLNDKKQIEEVKKNRIALRDARVHITKTGKELREEATAFNKAVIAKEKELIAIIEPEEKRLKEIEEEAKAIKTRNERLAILPQRKQQLSVIGDNVEVSDQELLEMDDTAFISYMNQRVSNKNEADRAEIELKQQEQAKEAERLENEKKAREREEQARKEERERAEKEKKEAYEKEQRERLEARIKSVRDLGLTLNMATNAYVLDDFYVPFLDIQTMSDIDFAQLVTRIGLEQSKREENARIEREQKAEQERIEQERKEKEANIKYQKWLYDNGYSEEKKDEFILEEHGHCTVLYKLVSTYYPEDNN